MSNHDYTPASPTEEPDPLAGDPATKRTARKEPPPTIVVHIALAPDHPIMPSGLPCPTFLTEDQFCALTGCKRRTLQDYRKQRLVRGFMNGTRVMFHVSEVNRFAEMMKEKRPA